MNHLRNLNIFLPCYAFLIQSAMGFIFILVSFLHVSQYSRLALYLTPALPLFLIWYKSGLSPVSIKEGRENRFKIGHWILAIINISATLAIVLPELVSYITGNREMMGIIMWLLVPIVTLGIPVSIAGLFMVWSSRA